LSEVWVCSKGNFYGINALYKLVGEERLEFFIEQPIYKNVFIWEKQRREEEDKNKKERIGVIRLMV